MFRRAILLITLAGFLAVFLESCQTKNRCAACPGDKQKRVKRTNKGSI